MEALQRRCGDGDGGRGGGGGRGHSLGWAVAVLDGVRACVAACVWRGLRLLSLGWWMGCYD